MEEAERVAVTNVMCKRRTMPKEKPLNEIVGKVAKKRKKEGNWKRNIERDVKGTAADAGCITKKSFEEYDRMYDTENALAMHARSQDP